MPLKLAFSNAFIMLSGSNHQHLGRGAYLPCNKEMQSKSFPIAKENEYSPAGQRALVMPHHKETATLGTSSELQFTKLQQINREIREECRYFGEYVAREAQLDEEYWAAAWLRAESHWEDRPNDRYVDSYKRQFAEQEFNALKRKSQGYNDQKSACIVMLAAQYLIEKRSCLEMALSMWEVFNENDVAADLVIPSGYIGQFARLLEQSHNKVGLQSQSFSSS